MGRWLTPFQEEESLSGLLGTDSTDNTYVKSVLSVSASPKYSKVLASQDGSKQKRWNPELAEQGYQWCLDCQHWLEISCSHPENPFRHQQPLAPRKCRWYLMLNE